jgi:class 3 adenylate cyclase
LSFNKERRRDKISNVSTEIDKLLQRAASADIAELMSIWRSRAPEEGAGSPAFFRHLGERILAQGEPLLAYDVISAGLATWPQDVRLRQLQGLALARSGASERAHTILEELRDEAQTTEETLGMLARTYKDLAATAQTPERHADYLKRAAETYTDAYRKTGGYWTGINAATMNLLIGETDRARELAKKVRDQCLQEINQTNGEPYWKFAALGESALVCRDLPQAAEWYLRAAEAGKGRYGDLNSSRRNARLILDHWKEDPTWIDNYLSLPSVVVFAGHMIDSPDRQTPRFPQELESIVANQIREKVDQLKPGFGFSSAACGSDILFLEAMLERGAEISVVLPYNEDEFIRDSVDFIVNSKWHDRFDGVVARAARVITASSQRLAIGGVSYEFGNQLMLGLATIRSRQLETKLVPLAVWDGTTGGGPGGTDSVIENWHSLGLKPEIIDLAKLEGHAPSCPKSDFVGSVRAGLAFESRPAERSGSFTSRIVAILFADAVGFSKLSEAEVPRFVEHFLGTIAKLGEKFADSILAKNTWGDGLYFVFSNVDAAGKFALDLGDLMTVENWQEKGLPVDLNLRIALHAGPVYEFDDPITRSRNYSGTHVSRAARIEPITPRGQVYASEAFAALAAAHGSKTFTCDYIGQTPMAKGYGTLPTYHVRKAAP